MKLPLNPPNLLKLFTRIDLFARPARFSGWIQFTRPARFTGLTLLAGAALALTAVLSPLVRGADEEAGFVIVQAADITWDETSERIQSHILHGDPSQEGLYVMRVRFPAAGSSSPHYHSQDRFITVMEGTWHAGTDASHDMSRTTAIPVGGFMIHPAGAVHYDGSRDGPVVVEIRGMGPVDTVRVDATP